MVHVPSKGHLRRLRLRVAAWLPFRVTPEALPLLGLGVVGIVSIPVHPRSPLATSPSSLFQSGLAIPR